MKAAAEAQQGEAQRPGEAGDGHHKERAPAAQQVDGVAAAEGTQRIAAQVDDGPGAHVAAAKRDRRKAGDDRRGYGYQHDDAQADQQDERDARPAPGQERRQAQAQAEQRAGSREQQQRVPAPREPHDGVLQHAQSDCVDEQQPRPLTGGDAVRLLHGHRERRDDLTEPVEGQQRDHAQARGSAGRAGYGRNRRRPGCARPPPASSRASPPG